MNVVGAVLRLTRVPLLSSRSSLRFNPVVLQNLVELFPLLTTVVELVVLMMEGLVSVQVESIQETVQFAWRLDPPCRLLVEESMLTDLVKDIFNMLFTNGV